MVLAVLVNFPMCTVFLLKRACVRACVCAYVCTSVLPPFLLLGMSISVCYCFILQSTQTCLLIKSQPERSYGQGFYKLTMIQQIGDSDAQRTIAVKKEKLQQL